MPARDFPKDSVRRGTIEGGEFVWIDIASADPDSIAPPLLLVHGFTGHRDDFDGVARVLAQHRRVIVSDLRGHGDSCLEPGPLGFFFEQNLRDLIGLLDHLGIERCDLLGHSMGGMLSLRLVLAHPERFRSLILMCTAPEAPASLPRSGFERAAEIAEARGMAGLQALMEKAGRLKPSAAIQSWGEHYWLHQRRRLGAMTPASYRGVGSAFFDSESLVDRLGEIDLPTLVLVGEADTDFLPGADLFEQRLPDVVRVTIKDAEHHPHRENRSRFIQAVEHHLATVDRGAHS
jgi:2-succinyl-6-hydroxy-2,4-cyclohexadiene-1-carboxylate synthase